MKYDNKNQISSSSGLTVILLLASLIVLFFLVVAHGWIRLLAPVVGDAYMAGGLAFLLTVIALLAAKLIGEARAETIHQEAAESTGSAFGWVILYPFLFIVSALGTINTAFYSFEGSALLQQKIDEAQGNLSVLQSTATALLHNQKRENKLAAVSRLLTKLKGEIVNPNGGHSCGVKDNARETMREIMKILPDFAERSPGKNRFDCDKSDFNKIYLDYEAQAKDLLDRDQEYIQENGPAKVAYLSTLAQRVGVIQDDLSKAKEKLTGNAVEQIGTGYVDAEQVLERAASIYNDERSQLFSLNGNTLPPALPKSIDVDQSRHLGSIISIIPTLLSRWKVLTTYLYPLIAIAFDLALVFLFSKASFVSLRKTKRRHRDRSFTSIIRSDPEFLWVNSSEIEEA